MVISHIFYLLLHATLLGIYCVSPRVIVLAQRSKIPHTRSELFPDEARYRDGKGEKTPEGNENGQQREIGA